MPQKSIYIKYPLLTVPHSFLSNGLIRTDDLNIRKLYQNAQAFLNAPSVWEGVFRLAALLSDHPLTEPVTGLITAALTETEDGAFIGCIEEQIAVARAGMALFEYNTDRKILKRIASWCRYLEIEWDQLFAAGKTLFIPADLMELLVNYYKVSGIKSVLRLCTKLRSAAFDWTTALHTIQQVIPLESTEEEQISFIDRIGINELDYDQKQILLNHAETLADGIRYTLYSGVFSGNRQDLTAGKTAWKILQKHYRAICGGTTAGPFLSGSASNAEIGTAALAAWTEAFVSQLLLSGSEWAADEMIRIVFNGLSYCLHSDKLPEYQMVNCIGQSMGQNNTAKLYAKVSRAAAAAFRGGITVTENGIMINYLMPARYLTMIRKEAVILYSDGGTIRFGGKKEKAIIVDLFRARTETADLSVHRGDEEARTIPVQTENSRNGQYIRLEDVNFATDSIHFEQNKKIYCENTHHQGICWFVRNRLMVYESDEQNYHVAVEKEPEAEEKEVNVTLFNIDGWHLQQNEPEDIPVLPSHCSEAKTVRLVPYDQSSTKVSMFPRINPLCLK
jgi:hypothetical protein